MMYDPSSPELQHPMEEAMAADRPESGAEIARFWAWFNAHEAELRALHGAGREASGELSRRMSRALSKATELEWEIGPGSTEDTHRLALCPSTKDELEEAKRFIASATSPPPERWELSAGRTAKIELPELKLRFRGKYYEIPLKGWTYELTGFDSERFFDVTVYPAGLELPEALLRKAARLAVQLLLGDVAFVNLIDRVELAAAPQSDPTALELLRQHLEQIAHRDVAGWLGV